MNKRPTPRPHQLPPVSGTGDVNGQIFTDEVGDPFALALYKTCRSLRLWVDRYAEIAPVFSPGAFVNRLELLKQVSDDADLSSDLQVLAEILSNQTIAEASVACGRVAQWASNRGASGVALEFLELAALLSPTDPNWCRDAGRLARTRGDFVRAEIWFRHGIQRGRASGDWSAVTWSLIGLGIVARLRGNLSGAEAAFGRALRRARRHRLHPVVAAAYHELMITAIRRNNLRSVVTFARQASRSYPAGDPRIHALAHDLAAFWLKRGFYEASLRVFHAIPETFGSPLDQLAKACNELKASGSLRLTRDFSRALARLETLLQDPSTDQHKGLACLSVAVGAHEMGNQDLALRWASEALAVARSRAEAQVESEAEALIDQLATHRSSPQTDELANAPRPISTLAEELVAALSH
jgi:tetratricopeptide (TPR) repeat protein